MALYRFFKMATVDHLGFLKVGNFNCGSVTVPNFVPIGQTIA